MSHYFQSSIFSSESSFLRAFKMVTPFILELRDLGPL